MIADIIAEDRNEEPVLFVEVKVRPASREDLEQFTSHLLAADSPFFYGMLVDPEKIVVLRRDVEHPDSLVELSTADVLSQYVPDYREQASKRGTPGIFHDYLRVLVDVWLDDLASHWKSDSPPGAQELSRIGLLERLENGTTRSEVILDGDRLR